MNEAHFSLALIDGAFFSCARDRRRKLFRPYDPHRSSKEYFSSSLHSANRLVRPASQGATPI
jgi:hypothetical protein